ncbi:MAG: NVEALA domain-containing protein [Bacteroidales bacterium]|nr:NVEALA domain-containing protein [Bacteroidales bacterium]
MKKIILSGIAAIVIAALAVVNVNMNSQSENLLSDIALANVEALAQENGDYNKGFVHCEGSDVICVGSGSLRCCK